jgi:hypothetical protein
MPSVLKPVRIFFATSLVVAAAVFSGCVSIVSESVSQINVIGNVEITTTLCFAGPQPPGAPPCPNSNYQGDPGGPQGVTAYLLAYRIKDGIGAPDTITAEEAGSLVFHRNTSYTDSLTATAPPPAGEHWVGYRSENSGAPSGATLKPQFTLPQANGKPFQGPFKYRTVVGFIDDNSPNSDDPVVCGTPPTTSGAGTPANNSKSICVDYPADPDYTTDQDFATRDLAVSSTGNGGALQNESTTMPFSADFAGTADASATFKVAATTDAPGVTLTPSTGDSFAPATASTTPITVKADMSPTTPTGTYDVVLVASLENGAERRATGKLVVGLGKPVNFRLPDITGTDAVGKTVACDNGDWSSSPAKYAYEWKSDGTAIPGATSQTLVLTQAEGAKLVTCTVTATNDAGAGVATSGPIRVAQPGGADVDLTGDPSIKRNADGSYTLDTGITISCPPRLPKACGGGTHVDAETTGTTSSGARAARTTEIASAGFSTKSGGKQKIVLKLTRRGAKLFKTRKKLSLVARVITRNHLLQRVSSKKRFSITRPR